VEGVGRRGVVAVGGGGRPAPDLASAAWIRRAPGARVSCGDDDGGGEGEGRVGRGIKNKNIGFRGLI